MTMRFNPQGRRLLAGFAVLLLGFSPVAWAQRTGDVEVIQAQALPSIPGARNGGGFLTIVNHGKTDERIVAAISPACGHVELHTMRMENNLMRMREVSDIALPAGQTVRMQPGSGYHLMLMDLKQPLKLGDLVPVTIKLASGAQLDVQLKVEPRETIGGGRAMPSKGMHPGMH